MTKQFYTIGSLGLSKQTSLHRCMHTNTDAKTADNKKHLWKARLGVALSWCLRHALLCRLFKPRNGANSEVVNLVNAH